MSWTNRALRVLTSRTVVGWARHLTRGGALVQGPAERPVVALTFDDGPDPRWTPAILDALAQGDARATFFCVGAAAERHPALVRRIAAAGHAVGTHLWSHDRTTVHHEATFLDELRRSTALLSELSGHPTRWVRYPYGRQGASTHAILRRQDLAAVHWTVSSHDTRESDAGRIVARLDATIRRGAIVLMHDGIADEHTSPPKPPYLPTRDSGVAALPLLLRLLQSRGLSAVTLDELFA